MAIKPNDTYTPKKDELMGIMLNKIGKQEFSNRKYKNPLDRLKGGFISCATEIEEIYIGSPNDTGYQKDGAGVLDRNETEYYVQYHSNEKSHGYACTVDKKNIRKAFLSSDKIQSFNQNIVTMLHSKQEVDDYSDCLEVMKALVTNNKLTTNVITIPPVVDEISAKKLTKEIKKVIPKMKEMTELYSDKPNFANVDDLILFIDSDTDVEMQIELLATVFNKSVAELNQTTKYVIPNLVDKIGSVALLCHNKCLKINPTYYDLGSINNTRGKFINYDLVTETLLSYTTWFPYVIFKEGTPTNK